MRTSVQRDEGVGRMTHRLVALTLAWGPPHYAVLFPLNLGPPGTSVT
jgi:hypothetical protein